MMLGPQRPQPNVPEALSRLDVAGPVALITAGWQDAEAESAAELEAALGHASVNLSLYARAEALLAADPALAEAYRQRQDRLIDLQRTYRIRLRHAVAAVRELAELKVESRLLHSQSRSAIAQIRTVDRHHLKRIARIHQQFESSLPPPTASTLEAEREAIADLVNPCSAILMAGGHVAVLMNRMRLFGLQHLLPTRPLIAWSAGAMAVSERVVVYHDHAPQGRHPAEVLDVGFGIQPGIVPLPDAAVRLDWSDRPRLGFLARRFSPAKCVTLDNGALLSFAEGELIHAQGAASLDGAGRARSLRAA